MKHKLLRILPFLLLGGVLGLAAAPAAFEAAETKAADAQVVSFGVSDFEGKGKASPGSKVEVTKSNVTITAGNAYGTTQFRVFSGSTFSIKSTGFKMSKLEFTFSSNDYTGGLNSSYNIDTDNWSTDSGKLSKQARFMSITVTLAASDATMSSIELDTSKAKLNYVQGEKLSTNGVKVNGTMSNSVSTVVTDKCTFSPANDTVLSDIGTETITVTYPSNSVIPTTSGSDLTKTYTVTVTEKPAEMLFTLVTDVNDLEVGDMVLIANTNASKAAKSVLTQDSNVEYKHYLDIDSITINGNNATYDDSSSVSPYILRAGTKSGTFAFESENGKYIAPYDDTNNGLVLSSSITNEASWSLSNSGNDVDMSAVINGATRYLRYNSNAFRMYGSGSAVAKVNLYKYASGLEKVTLDASTKDVYEGYSTTISATASGFTATSWAWESSNSEYVEVYSGGDSATVTIKGVAEGSSNLTVAANGKYKATCVVTCKGAGSLVIEPGDYFITNLTNKYMMGSDLSNVEDVDISQSENLYTFEFAGYGDGTYWISNTEGKYLAFRQNVIPDGKRVSEMTLTDEKVDYWTVTKNTSNQYKVATDYQGTAKSIAQDGDHDWLAFSGDNFVNLTKQGTFKEFRIGHEPQYKKYYVGEKFKITGLVVNAVFDVDGSEFLSDVTAKIVWDDLKAGTEATGTYTCGGVGHKVTVGGLSILGPVVDSMEVTGLRDTYLIGEMPRETIEEVKVTYSDGSNEEVKTLTDADINVSPDKINSDTTKVVVSMVDFPEVKYEKEITAEHAKYFATNMIEIGDKVTLGTTVGAKDGNITGGQEIAIVDGQLGSQTFGYLPTPAMEFEVVQGVSAGSYAFKYNDMYLTSNGKTLDFGHVSNITGYKNENNTWSFDYPFMLEGQSEPLYVHFDESIYTPGDLNGYVYSYERGAQIQATGIMEDGIMMLGFDLYKPISTMTPVHSEVELTYEINGSLVIYLPSSQEVNTKNSFTCNFVESQNDWVDDYWVICPLNEPEKHVWLNPDSGKFGVSTSGDYDIMFYRDMTRDFSHEIKSISVSIPEDMPTTVELGEPFNWVGITVKAKYDNTTKKLPLGAYEVEVPPTDTYGEKTCTVTYGTSGNKVTATFKFTVVGGYQPFIKQNTYEVWVDDTNTFTTTQEPPEGQPVTWSSSNPEIADFEDPSVGDLTSYKSGKVTIKVTSYDGYYSDSKELTVSQRPTGLTLDTTEKTIKQGEKFTIVGTVSPADAKNKTVLWSSSDPEIATVSSKGEVTGLGIGDVVITGQTQGKGTGEEEGYKATCTVHVEEGEVVRVTGVSLDCNYKELKPGDTFQLNAIVNPSNATNKNVTWESNAPHLADVSNSGKVTVKNSADTGKTVYITCTTEDGGFTTRCEIKIKASVEPIPVTSVTLNTTSKQIEVDGSFELIATVKPDNADTKQVSFETLAGDIVSINQTSANEATITGLKEGTAVIEASCGGKTARCTVTVHNTVNVESVSIDKTDVQLAINETEQLNAIINPSNADNQAVSWKSSDTKVVTVDSDGMIKAVGVGEAIITVKTNDGGKTATCKVTVTQKGANYTGVVIGVSCGVGAVGIGCGVGIPLGIKAHKKRKIAK